MESSTHRGIFAVNGLHDIDRVTGETRFQPSGSLPKESSHHRTILGRCIDAMIDGDEMPVGAKCLKHSRVEDRLVAISNRPIEGVTVRFHGMRVLQ